MSKSTTQSYARLHESRARLDRLIGMQAVEGRIDPREADLILEAVSRLNEAWSGLRARLRG